VKYANYLATLVLGLCYCGTASSQQACPPTGPIAADAALLCWVNATQDINGAPLPATGPGALTQTRVQRAVVGATATCAFTTVAEALNVLPAVTSVLFQALPAGKHCFRARHVSLDAAGAEMLSDWSPTASKVAVPPIGKSKPLTITIY
jgi:hypothetical protein